MNAWTHRPDLRVKDPNFRASTDMACSMRSDWWLEMEVAMIAEKIKDRDIIKIYLIFQVDFPALAKPWHPRASSHSPRSTIPPPGVLIVEYDSSLTSTGDTLTIF